MEIMFHQHVTRNESSLSLSRSRRYESILNFVRLCNREKGNSSGCLPAIRGLLQKLAKHVNSTCLHSFGVK